MIGDPIQFASARGGALGMPQGVPQAMPGGMPPQQPMVPNPAFMQWMKQKQAWDAESQKRQKEFLSACELIKDDAPNSYKIDIEADSTIAADEQAEKQARTEFLQAMTPFLEAMIPLAQANPDLRPLVKELVLFGVRGFPVSRQLEDAFEAAFQRMEQMPPPQPQTNGKNTKTPQELQLESMETAGKLQGDQQANATKQMQIFSDAKIAGDKLTAQQDKDATEFMIRLREIEGREAMMHAKEQHMAARDAGGIV